jgi:putative endopeptidase
LASTRAHSTARPIPARTSTNSPAGAGSPKRRRSAAAGGRSFSEIHKRNLADLKAILEGAQAKKEGPLGKLGAYYGACMNEKAIEAAKTKPIKDLLAAIKRVRSRRQLVAMVQKLHQEQVWVLFSLWADQDFGDATQIIAQLDQAGLGLPDRDYYLDKKPRSEKIRAAYLEHVRRMLQLAGFSKGKAKRAAKQILAIETQLAKASKTRVQRRDPKGMYNKTAIAELAKKQRRVAWKAYFKALGLPSVRAANVTAPSFFEEVDKMLAKVRIGHWRSYLTWHVLQDYASTLGKPFVDESFKLRQLLTGQKKQRPRWKRCVAATDGALGELLAQPFVKKRFSEQAKKDVTMMVGAISSVFSEHVKALPWMDDKTRGLAEAKRQRMAFLIGYPNKWKQYPFEVGASYAKNARAARRHELIRQLKKIGKPVDHGEWEMSPPTVNAYYHPNKNHMVFPAGILQPPFYSEKAGLAVNMGGMGMVVGHELTHGFDDQGAKFDGAGNLKNWWSDTVKAKFEKRTKCMVGQYEGYKPLPDINVNGKLTLGENIADAGGVKLAYRAFKRLRKSAKARIVAEGFTEEQQFFLSVGQIWCMKAREALTRMRVKTDPHSPPRFRVNGSLANLPEFAEAFKCQAGSPMAPKNRCEVW